MHGKLNSFQKTMLHWNDLHPYNAVHVVRVPGPLDAARLAHVIRDTLATRGLAGLSLDRARGTYRFQGGAGRCEVSILDGGEAWRDAMIARIVQELNTPFVLSAPFDPFRFFVAPAPESFAVGLVYFHPVADGVSIALLLKQLVDAYRGRSGAQSNIRPELYPRPNDRLLLRRPAWLARACAELPRFVKALRHAARPGFHDARDMRNGFVCLSLASDDLRGLLRTAREWEVTFNDLLLAALLLSLAPMGSGRLQAPRRRNLAAGTIVDIRRELGVDSRQAFGLFLGSFVVTHEVPEGINLRALAREVHAQTDQVKRHHLYLATPAQLAFLRFVLSFFSTERRLSFYQKHYPLWGGITNMRLDSLWEPQADDGPLDYIRAVSTGPATPLVLSVTTWQEQLTLGLSFRETVFSAQQIAQFQSRFLGILKQTRPSP